jgi:hypothetical protein
MSTWTLHSRAKLPTFLFSLPLPLPFLPFFARQRRQCGEQVSSQCSHRRHQCQSRSPRSRDQGIGHRRRGRASTAHDARMRIAVGMSARIWMLRRIVFGMGLRDETLDLDRPDPWTESRSRDAVMQQQQQRYLLSLLLLLCLRARRPPAVGPQNSTETEAHNPELHVLLIWVGFRFRSGGIPEPYKRRDRYNSHTKERTRSE